MIYVLLLEEQKIYVGFSERPVGERFLEHFNRFGSKWTTLYRPLQVLHIFEGGLQEENQLTLQMMDKYGWYNVRGGSWCQVEMSSCPPALLEYKGLKLPPELGSDGCQKCGRNSHTKENCFAKFDIRGNPIQTKSATNDCKGKSKHFRTQIVNQILLQMVMIQVILIQYLEVVILICHLVKAKVKVKVKMKMNMRVVVLYVAGNHIGPKIVLPIPIFMEIYCNK